MKFLIKNYTEQPGLDPKIKDVRVPTFESLSANHQKLLCEGYKIGSNIYKGTRMGRSVNRRVYTASGMAALEIGQLISEYWNQPASMKNKVKNISWRRSFDIAVKWIRFAETYTPTFWVDKENTEFIPYSHYYKLVVNNQTDYRFETYFPALYKIFIENLKIQSEARKVKVNSSNAVENFFQLHKELSICSQQLTSDGKCPVDTKVTVALNEVNSKKVRGEKQMKGALITIHSNREKKMNLTVKVASNMREMKNFHVELDYIWRKIDEERNKLTENPTSASVSAVDPIVNLIVSMMFYFVNLMPVSSATPEVAYSTMVGLMLGLGRETTGNFPKGRELFMEALTHSDPEKFRSVVRRWITFKYSRTVHSYISVEAPKVSEYFPTYRSIVQSLLLDLEDLCKS